MSVNRLLLCAILSSSLLAADPTPFELKPTIEGLLAPDDLQIELIGKDPLINNPAAMCIAPDGRIFVCEDYVHARVPGHTRDVVKVLVGPEKGGVATEAITVAENLNSVQGLAFHDGTLYIAHSPKLSIVKISADNKAGPVEDLFTGIGYDRPIKPAHGASGLFAHENRIYIVFGDQGCDFTDREGKRVNIDTGAILRCDPDGSNLEVFAHGFRNIYGTAIDPHGNVFVRDNTNDGGGYNVRNYHVVKGAYYGWPFRWREGDSATPPIDVLTKSRDLGGGSPCGNMWLNSRAWPEKYNNAVLGSEWGKAHIAFIRPVPQGATYDLPEQKLIADARQPGSKYEFRPTVAALHPDQSIIIADWATGPLYPTEKKGRLFRVKPKASANAPSTTRLEDTLAQMADAAKSPNEELLKLLKDAAPAIRARAAYILGERKFAAAAPQLTALLTDADPTVRLRAATALGDFKDAKNLSSLANALATEKDRWVRHLLLRGFRLSGDIPTQASAIKAAPPAVQKDLLYALRDLYDEAAVAALIDFAKSGSSEVRATAVEFLGLVAKKEAKRWAWGDKPTIQASPRDQDWAATEKISAFLRETVSDKDLAVRKAALGALQKIKDTGVVDMVLASVRENKAKGQGDGMTDDFAQILINSTNNEKAVAELAGYLKNSANSAATRIEVAQLFGLWKDDASIAALQSVAFSADAPTLRAAAIEGLARRKDSSSAAKLIDGLKAPEAEIQRAAARALGLIGVDSAVDALKAAAASNDRPLKAQALAALFRIEKNGATDAFLRALVALPAAEDAFQTELLELIGGSAKNKLEPILCVWLESGTPGKNAETGIVERLDKKQAGAFALSPGNSAKREAAAPKIAAYRAKTYPKFKVPENLKAAQAPVAAEDEEVRWERLLKASATSTGDAKRGAAIFRDLRGANCIGCHIVGAEGRRVGPELTEVASKYTRSQLAESVLFPSRQLLDGYEQSILTLKSGERFSGIVMKEDAEKLTVAKNDGSSAIIPRSEISKTVKSKNSLMPDGLANSISDQDFYDLIEYMETLKKQ